MLEYATKSRDQGFFSDVTIVAGNEKLPANRLVLSCYSSYLKGMFKFQESNLTMEHIIEIKAVDGKALKALIDFIYTGSITITEQNVKNLLSGAHYVQIHEVKQFCFEFLRSNTTVDNALNFLKTAGHYRNEGLKNKIQQYISINFDQVLKSDHFKQLSIEELISCISNLDRSQAKEISIFQAIVTWCNHDKQDRNDSFVELFNMLNLANIAPDYMEKVVLEEKLVTKSPDCYKTALTTYHKLVNEEGKNQTLIVTLQKQNKENENYQTSKLLCLGGIGGSEKLSVVYNLSNGSSVNYPDLSVKIRAHCSLSLNGYIYCIGGDKTNENFLKGSDKVWRLNLKKPTSTWKQVASMNTKRCAMGATVNGDVIVVAGGSSKFSLTLRSSEVYQPSFNKWQTISSLKRPKFANALVSCDGYLYAIGGCKDRSMLSSVERLSNLKRKWIDIESMQTPRGYVAAVNCDGVVYAIGGKSGKNDSTTLKTVEKYDSTANTWKYVSDMNFKRRAHAASVLRNKIYVVGGIDADAKVVTQIECYDPTCDTWSIVVNATEKLYWHTVVAV